MVNYKCCDFSIERGKSVQCHICNLLFHYECVELNESDVGFFSSRQKVWKCPSCVLSSKEPDCVESKSQDSVLEELLERVKRIQEDQRDMKFALSSFCETVASQEDRLDDLEVVLLDMEDTLDCAQPNVGRARFSEDESVSQIRERAIKTLVKVGFSLGLNAVGTQRPRANPIKSYSASKGSRSNNPQASRNNSSRLPSPQYPDSVITKV